MKQITQSLSSGQTILEDVPVPVVAHGSILIRTTCSLVSLGTERMLVQFGSANLVNKARQQPDKVKMVFDKLRSDGLRPTIDAVRNKLYQPVAMGYCNVGIVVDVGPGVDGFKIGDRIASNGHHAEYVCVPANLCARIPDSVEDDEAAFTVIGAIALQGIRLTNPTFGETIAVVGLGLIGLLAAQLLRANGCRVIGIDPDHEKVVIAQSLGIDAIHSTPKTNPVTRVMSLTSDIGADGVLITATSKSNSIIEQAAQMSRKRGRIILVGVVGLDISRADFYDKELTFQVSCSYGPGRYDDDYEQKGNDYPIGFVRWTEKRNFEAVLAALGSGQVNVAPLITARVPLRDYEKIYANMSDSSQIASLLIYDSEPTVEHRSVTVTSAVKVPASRAILAIVGAGNYTSATLVPSLKPHKPRIKYIVSATGLSATILAKKVGAEYSSTDYEAILKDNDVNLVMITTRHNLHARMVIDALSRGKHVFVEKPLCLSLDELDEIRVAYQKSNDLMLMVGFNRRFAPLAIGMKELIGDDPINLVVSVNAGFIPGESWVQDLDVGGGRIIGEGCHFIDLCAFLTGSLVRAVCMNSMGVNPSVATDNASILLKFDNGSNATINYFANGHKGYSKERVELYSQGRVLVMDNWKTLQGWGFKKRVRHASRQNKGHGEQFAKLLDKLESGGESLIPFSEISNVTEASFAAIESLREKRWVELGNL